MKRIRHREIRRHRREVHRLEQAAVTSRAEALERIEDTLEEARLGYRLAASAAWRA